jgi:DNA-directed RNA polymerase alpha subunit
MENFNWKDEQVLKFAKMSTQGSYGIFKGVKNLQEKLEVFKRAEGVNESTEENTTTDLWTQVFLASISSGSSVDISFRKADRAIEMISNRKEGREKVVKITSGTSLSDILPSGVANCLRSEEITELRDLEGLVPRKLLHIRNFGEGAMKNIVELVESYTGNNVSINSPINLKINKKNERTKSKR